MKSTELDLYTDYLLSSFGAATATGLSQMVDGAVSHDKVTRFLSGRDYTSRTHAGQGRDQAGGGWDGGGDFR